MSVVWFLGHEISKVWDCNSQTYVTHPAAQAALARVNMEVGLD